MTTPHPTNEPLPAGIARRRVLQLPATLAAVAGFGRLARSAPLPDVFDALTERWTALHAELDPDASGSEDAYLYELAAALTRVPVSAFPSRDRTVYDAGGLTTGPAWIGGSIFLVEVVLAPDAVLAPHNHPGFCVLTLGVEGACEVRHYEPHGDAPPAQADTPSFQLRERLRKWITPGRSSALTRTRDNIHAFRAGPDGATLLDFTTQLGDTSVGFERFSALELEGASFDAAGSVVPARWVGDPYR